MHSERATTHAPPVPLEEAGAPSFGVCGNCGAALSGRFCSQCGEKKLTAEDYSLAHLAEETIDVFTHFDSRFFRTLKVLFTRPGELSRAYFHGGRSRYTKPLTVFVIINIVFFLVQPHTGLLRYKYSDYMRNPAYASRVRTHLADTKEPEPQYAARFNTVLQNQKKSLLIVSVPILAMVMGALFAGTGRKYAEHLVFSVQVYTFLLSYLAASIVVLFLPLDLLITALGPRATGLRVLEGETGITVVVIVGLTTYMYLGFRRAYDATQPRAFIAAFILAWAVGFLTGVYHNALFFATYFTT